MDPTQNGGPGASSAGASPAPPGNYVRAPEGDPTQAGPLGIRFDFNHGCRLKLPEGRWRVRFTDLDTEDVLAEAPMGPGLAASPHIFFQRIGIEVFRGDEQVFSHAYDGR